LVCPNSTFGKFTPIRAHGCNISESDAKQVEGVGVNQTPLQILEVTTTPEVATAAAARTLTFAEIQALIEQGKTDEIPNNKHIPDALNVGLTSFPVAQ